MKDLMIVVLTGATSGLGRIVARRLAVDGVHLVLPVRDERRGDDLRQELHRLATRSAVDVFVADLSLMADVSRLGTDIAAAVDRVDVLINNAGLHAFAPRGTVEGLPEMMAVNYLAPWLLTEKVMPALSRASGGRVVNVASEASRRHGTLGLPSDLTDTRPFTGRQSSALYGKTKLLDIMFTMELARRTAAAGMTANCLDPGFNVTGLGRELSFAAPLERVLKALRIGDPARGAHLIHRVATSSEFDGVTGAYIGVRHAEPLVPAWPAGDEALQERLWDDTAALLEPWR
ncbi:short-subunit dehydrogenase [Frondihabitans australicus]|uniref:Short-subunit dehydrogenase n=1 Tax=Frondihabitans australicus TaxID=386892 RepID=A0A495IMK1_9MICO|nr:short-subunit dehydrogenase [Frondihabitans australicus]